MTWIEVMIDILAKLSLTHFVLIYRYSRLIVLLKEPLLNFTLTTEWLPLHHCSILSIPISSTLLLDSQLQLFLILLRLPQPSKNVWFIVEAKGLLLISLAQWTMPTWRSSIYPRWFLRRVARSWWHKSGEHWPLKDFSTPLITGIQGHGCAKYMYLDTVSNREL